MTLPRITEWRKLPTFRWRQHAENEWSCALHGRILCLRQDPTHIHYRAIFPCPQSVPLTPPPSGTPSTASVAAESLDEDDDTASLLRHYFNLTPNLTELYEQWSAADQNFKKKAPKFTGIRILKQDAWEALVGFICSSNNNIVRISQMVDKLCLNYGTLVGYIDSKPYHDFPAPSALTDPQVEQHLRQLGFGYRAKYLHQTAVMVSKEREAGWLDGLRNPESPILGAEVKSAGEMKEGGREGYREAHEQLLELQGVGPKVADCVCLMGLGWGEAVPVDTHGELNFSFPKPVFDNVAVWQIAQRDYKFGKGKHKSLTKATYDAVGDHFRKLWGKEAGWAHSVLFTADLKAFSARLTTKVEVKEDTSVVVAGDEKIKIEKTVTTKVINRKSKREGDEEEETLESQTSASGRRLRKRPKA
ncbi:MAG: hypothetical protein M1819_002528 [Sarea resinae]|nr:MAG: hypothetical protein M1819_002528 [Sarea resinae]